MSKDLKNQNLPSFEDFKHENGVSFWYATEFMTMLGYNNMLGFQKVINRAIKACLSLNIAHHVDFSHEKRIVDGGAVDDYRLTRFACYLVAMNGDPKKPNVAAAQAYFAEQTRKLEIYLEGVNEIERLLAREELREGNKILQGAANQAGVTDYAKFTNAGYKGLYNMYNWQLADRRGLEKDKLHDYMGRTELAANLFRVTQTEEKLKSDNIKGQDQAERIHYEIARTIREMVIANTKQTPENLPVEKRLTEVKKDIKQVGKQLNLLDKKKK